MVNLVMNDEAPADFLCFTGFLKAMPVEDGADRFVYVEASKEARDFQGEKILGKALAASASYYQQYGNVDLDHISVVGARRGIPNPYLYEIGNPIEVRADGSRTFCKLAIFQGDTPVAAHANAFWDSITVLKPAKRWYPSVGGQVQSRTIEVDPETQEPTTVITQVRWSNIGFSETPVNPAVPGVSSVPIGLLAKSFTASGDLHVMAKGLTATPGGSDVATLTGGAALRVQSLDHRVQRTVPDFWTFREAISGDLKSGACKGAAHDIVDHAHAHYGVSRSDATDWTDRFLTGLRADLKAKGSPK